ncbi:3'-5' exonuclease [Vibrio alginolyticus]|uniref:3'-5' exonuclease n=1 Tax=Vibrio sp. B1FLJ16 TaxID=2751178 RepID=UPI0015F54012|nr:3'-5' exonuclease [Vibrio sp. B1FLJ16]CAD7807307.1 COG0847 DNA polymerase III [Vibrio sp. B1FLJ16]CAD7807776.1 COG0847 DNA polymerase III [Vibrio sp. B1FLJ16]CAE6904233.1 COG0847 DNA polymerase III [Vibrio sp. B1FLJ16]CAE6906453.1 COG0847 DNA polymerase III [Vibrio sp. B1FLJ16]
MLKKLFQKPSIQWNSKFEQKLALTSDQNLVAYYSAGLPAPDTPLSEVDFVAIDFETTGLDPDENDIITIGLVPFNLKRIYLRESRHWKVRPKQKLDEDSVIIHGITHSELIDAPDLGDILGELLPCLSGKIVVVHYRRIEREFLDKALRDRIGEGIEFPVLDTLQLEEDIQKNLTSSLWDKIKGKKPESLRLAQSRRRYGLPDYTPHHALTDAIATAELFQAQIAHHYRDSQAISEFWL